MPLLIDEAKKLSPNDQIRGVIEEFLDDEPLYALLPYTATSGKAYVYNREGTLADGVWLDPNDTVTESASTFTEVTTQLRILIGDVDVDKFIDGTMSNLNPQRAIQIAAKVKGMSFQFKDALINGTQAAKQFDGLQTLVNAQRVIDAGETALDLTMLDELQDAVALGADMIMMRSEHVRAYKQLMRTFGGNTGLMIQLPNFDKPVLSIDGVPIVVNDYIKKYDNAAANGKLSDIFAVRLNEVDGVHGLFAAGHPAGFDMEDIGTVQNKDATRTRIKQYCGLALKATHSLAKIGKVNIL